MTNARRAKDNRRLAEYGVQIGDEAMVRVLSWTPNQNGHLGTMRGVLGTHNVEVTMYHVPRQTFEKLPPSKMRRVQILSVSLIHLKDRGVHKTVLTAKPKDWLIAEHIVGPDGNLVDPDVWAELTSGGCYQCGDELDSKKHREIRWSKVQCTRTKIFKHQPTCPSCVIKHAISV
jgi:hypothetical protein